MRQCTTCNIKKKNAEFYKGERQRDGYYSECKICFNRRTLENQFIRKYNLTFEQRDAMIFAQNGRCAICNDRFVSSKKTHVDHCHTTNKVRAMLCELCNTALGGFKDSPKLLQRAIHYIEHHAKQNTTTPVSEGSYIQGAVGAELGSVSTPWTWEDYDHTDDYSGATRGENTYNSAKEGSGDGMGRGSKEVGPPQAPQSVQDHGQPEPEIVRLDFSRRHLSD